MAVTLSLQRGLDLVRTSKNPDTVEECFKILRDALKNRYDADRPGIDIIVKCAEAALHVSRGVGSGPARAPGDPGLRRMRRRGHRAYAASFDCGGIAVRPRGKRDADGMSHLWHTVPRASRLHDDIVPAVSCAGGADRHSSAGPDALRRGGGPASRRGQGGGEARNRRPVQGQVTFAAAV